MEVVLLIIHVITSVAIIVVILLQSGKGGGLGSGFGGASAAATQIFGGRGAGNFLSRTTVALAAIFMTTSLSLAYISSQPRSLMDLESGDGVTGPAEDEIIERGSGSPEPAAATPPGAQESGPVDAQQVLDQLEAEGDDDSAEPPAGEEPAPEMEPGEGEEEMEPQEEEAAPGASAAPAGGSGVDSATDTAPARKAEERNRGASDAPGGDTVEANAEEETILAPGQTDAPDESE